MTTMKLSFNKIKDFFTKKSKMVENKNFDYIYKLMCAVDKDNYQDFEKFLQYINSDDCINFYNRLFNHTVGSKATNCLKLLLEFESENKFSEIFKDKTFQYLEFNKILTNNRITYLEDTKRLNYKDGYELLWNSDYSYKIILSNIANNDINFIEEWITINPIDKDLRTISFLETLCVSDIKFKKLLSVIQNKTLMSNLDLSGKLEKKFKI